jgi:hypothetical protein
MKFGTNLCLLFLILNSNSWKILKIYMTLKPLFKVRGVIIYGILLLITPLYNTLKYLKLLKFRKIPHLIRKPMLFFIPINSFGLVLIQSKLLVILTQSLTKITG